MLHRLPSIGIRESNTVGECDRSSYMLFELLLNQSQSRGLWESPGSVSCHVRPVKILLQAIQLGPTPLDHRTSG